MGRTLQRRLTSRALTNGYTAIPKTGGATLSATMRYMSGSPFSIFNSNIDVDQNGELTDPSPAGTYSGTAAGNILMTGVKNAGGRNGAIGPDYFQLDLRAGWRGKLRKEDRTIEIFLDIFNITNRRTSTTRRATNGVRRRSSY